MTTDKRRPLDGVVVLDFSQVMAGPFCALQLADMGADVIKVERVDRGDDVRRNAPFYKKGWSAPFTLVNRNKRSVGIDLGSEKGRAKALRLASRADIVIENFRTGVLKRLGLGYEDVKKVNPSVVYCSISGFGQTGPYADRGGYDLIAQAMTGLMSFTGHPNMSPAKIGVPICDLTAGLTAAYGILAAYIHRLRTGEGQYVETSLFEAGLSYLPWEASVYFATGEVPEPLGSRHRISAPYQAFKTKDAYIVIGGQNQANYERLCAVLNRPDLLEDPRFKTGPDRKKNDVVLGKILEEVFVTKTTEEWMGPLLEEGLPCGPLYNLAQAFDDPQTKARNMVQTIHVDGLGDIKVLGNALKLSATPPENRMPPPTIGQHTDEVLTWAGFSGEEIAGLRKAGAVGSQPA
jgi:formyl-CoA transferase